MKQDEMEKYVEESNRRWDAQKRKDWRYTFAGQALVALYSGNPQEADSQFLSPEPMVRLAVVLADALLAELEKEPIE